MASQQELYDAVASIESPLIVGRTLGELDLVKDVSKTLTGKAKVQLALPVPNPQDELNRRLQDALSPYASGADVDVEVMDEPTAQKWMDDLKERPGHRRARIGHPHGGGVVGQGRGRKVVDIGELVCGPGSRRAQGGHRRR